MSKTSRALLLSTRRGGPAHRRRAGGDHRGRGVSSIRRADPADRVGRRPGSLCASARGGVLPIVEKSSPGRRNWWNTKLWRTNASSPDGRVHSEGNHRPLDHEGRRDRRPRRAAVRESRPIRWTRNPVPRRRRADRDQGQGRGYGPRELRRGGHRRVAGPADRSAKGGSHENAMMRPASSGCRSCRRTDRGAVRPAAPAASHSAPPPLRWMNGGSDGVDRSRCAALSLRRSCGGSRRARRRHPPDQRTGQRPRHEERHPGLHPDRPSAAADRR